MTLLRNISKHICSSYLGQLPCCMWLLMFLRESCCSNKRDLLSSNQPAMFSPLIHKEMHLLRNICIVQDSIILLDKYAIWMHSIILTFNVKNAELGQVSMQHSRLLISDRKVFFSKTIIKVQEDLKNMRVSRRIKQVTREMMSTIISHYASCVFAISVHTIANIQTKRYWVPWDSFASWGYRSKLDSVKIPNASGTIHSQVLIRTWSLCHWHNRHAKKVNTIHGSNKLARSLVKCLPEV